MTRGLENGMDSNTGNNSDVFDEQCSLCLNAKVCMVN